MTRYLKGESRAIYWLRFIRKGMELPQDVDLMSLTYAKKIARKLSKHGYQGEIVKVLQNRDALGWGTDPMNVRDVYTF